VNSVIELGALFMLAISMLEPVAHMYVLQSLENLEEKIYKYNKR